MIESEVVARYTAVSLAAALFLALVGTACRDRASSSEHVPDIPVYPEAVLTERIDETDRDPIDIYEVPDVESDAVLDWYRERMSDWGWTAVTDESDDVILYNDLEGCYAFVAATQQNGSVMLQLSQQRPGSPCMKGSPLPTGTE